MTSNKTFAVLAGASCDDSRGFDSYLESFDNIDDAVARVNHLSPRRYDWGQVVDLNSKRVAIEYGLTREDKWYPVYGSRLSGVSAE